MPEASARRIRLVHLTTVPITLGFLRGQAAFMRAAGIDTQAITSPGDGLTEYAAAEHVVTHPLTMARRISPLQDLAALSRLIPLLRRLRPDIVHAHTPKAGLLGMIASWIARVPVRIYHIHGLPFVTASGMKRRLLICSDRLSCALATRVLCVGPSVYRDVLAEGISSPDKAAVLLSGSINGVDAGGRFDPASISSAERSAVRSEANIPADAIVLGYLGRLVVDKGIGELVGAWERLSMDPRLHLLIVGPFEAQDALSPALVQTLTTDPRIHLVGLRWDTPRWLSAMDIVVLPTYREGLPVVPLEAGALAIPVVATRVPGCTDAIEDGITGTLVEPRDAEGLARAIERYVASPELRQAHGAAARDRMLRVFDPPAMWQALLSEYRFLLRKDSGTERTP